jgi:hypothetical protein
MLDAHEGLRVCWTRRTWPIAWWKRSTICISSISASRLIPLDTTVANVIAHQLIGEDFANQLDEAVHHAVDEMLNEESFALESVEAYREQTHQPGQRRCVEALAVPVQAVGRRAGVVS